jgi:formylmethanofuran:tetrahydromethanopterin formyltransferase
MTKQQAIDSLRQGRKVSHIFFMAGEFVFINKSGEVQSEDGVIHPEFWKLRNSPEWEQGWLLYGI